MTLSKSQVLLGLQCAKALWLKRRRPELGKAPDPGQERVFEQGREVGELARRRFPGGLLIGHPMDPGRAVRETKEALARGAPLLYEPAFEADGAFARADILVRGKAGWEIVEVKSSTKAEEIHLLDLAIQRHVLARAGAEASKACLLHVNSKYVRSGEIDLEAFFTLEDATVKTAALARAVPEQVARLAAAAAEPEPPAIAIGQHCEAPYECAFKAHCWSHVPEYSIHDLTRLSWKKRALLAERGVMRVEDVPADFALSDAQRRQVQVARSGRPRVDARAIRQLLGDLDFPLHFLDFETVNPAVPPYDGLRPYSQLPFQASVRVVRAPGEGDEHLDFLGDGRADPRRPLAAFLARAIGPKGTVIAYNASFESRCLEELVPHATAEQGTRLLSAQRRLWDLGEPFRQGFYVHPAFRGQWSIKAVLPALAPGMGYGGLAIQEGVGAQLAYLELMKGAEPERAARIRADLRAYCGQDTLGMVRIWESLGRAAAELQPD